MGKAKSFGVAAIILAILCVIATYFLAPQLEGTDQLDAFMLLVFQVWIPVLLLTIALVGVILGILLLIYG